MEKGKIIYLNGVSGTGKTTLSNTLQERANEPFYWVASDMFCSCIVDIVHTQPEIKILAESIKQLHEYPVLFVHVTCPSDELYRRKTKRGDPEVDKWLPYQFENFAPKEPYDITVDTHINTVEECADKILELLNYPEKFTAFKTLWAQRTE